VIKSNNCCAKEKNKRPSIPVDPMHDKGWWRIRSHFPCRAADRFHDCSKRKQTDAPRRNSCIEFGGSSCNQNINHNSASLKASLFCVCGPLFSYTEHFLHSINSFILFIHCVIKKHPHNLFCITQSIVNWFSEFFHCQIYKEILYVSGWPQFVLREI